MPVLSARGLVKAYGPQTLFQDVAITIVRGERVGLLGVNGTGKSTLLRVLAGLEIADEGTIDRRKDSTILYLSQEPELDPDKTPRQIVESGLGEWKAAINHYEELTKRLETASDDALVHEQSELAERIEGLGGWTRGHIVDDMLTKLGVQEPDRPVGSMSGGERRRVALAHVLVASPTLAILDEPTNHLDTFTIDWLEGYLMDQYKGAVLMVTHDRYVLDACCHHTYELDRGTLVHYQGGYGDYLDQKAERLAHEDRAEQNRMNFVRREKAWLSRGPKARSTKQKARIQRAEAVISADPINARGGNVDLGGLERGAAGMGKSVLDLEALDVMIGNKRLVKGLDLHLVTGERVGIVGPNGAGKTSLLRVVLGELKPSAGKAIVGTRTKIAMFDQARAQLRDDWSILDNVAEREGAERTGAGMVTFGKDSMEVRTYLEKFLFEGSKQRQKVGSLSGGERARVALAKMLKGGANLLLLDEPTNDLDIATLSALEELLESWPGCVLAVSHDRYFLDRVATSILSFEPDGRVIQYQGNYANYVSVRAPAQRPSAAPPAVAIPAAPPLPKFVESPARKPLSYSERTELDNIMSVIAAAEEKVTALEKTLLDPTIYSSKPDEAKKISANVDHTKAEIARLLTRWEDLESRRDVKK